MTPSDCVTSIAAGQIQAGTGNSPMTDTHTRSASAITPRFRQRRSAGHPHVAPRGSSLTHARYLKLEGMCWVLIGAASIVCSWPSLIVRETYIAPSVAAGAVVVLAIACVAALRCGLPAHHVHGWMCAGTLRSRTEAPSMRSTQAIWGLTRDAAIWVGATLGWLLLCRFGHVPPLISSGSISLGIGVGIVLIGLLEAILSPRFVRRSDQNVGAISLVVSRRPLGLGYPILTLTAIWIINTATTGTTANRSESRK
jgi:hypothetical protein